MEAADQDGGQLEKLSQNPHAARWRIWQLEMAGRENGAGGSFEFMQRLVREGKARHPQIQLSYGTALLRRGRPREALEALDSVPSTNGWVTSMRMLALFELPERRAEFDREVVSMREEGWSFVLQCKAMFLLYAGRPKEARALARRIISKTEIYNHLPPYDQRALNYLAGRLGEADFINGAQGVLPELCQVHCVIGLQHWADGHRDGAIAHFRESVDTAVFTGPLYHWSRVALAQLGRHPTWPPPSPNDR